MKNTETEIDKLLNAVNFKKDPNDEKYQRLLHDLSDKLSLIQPNSITTAKYKFTELQENILTCIMSSLQKHMKREKFLDVDMFGDCTCIIDTKDVSPDQTKKNRIVKAANEISLEKYKSTKTKEFGARQLKDSKLLKTYTKEAERLAKKQIKFNWKNPETDVYENVSVNLISSVRSASGSSLLALEISKWVMPYLLWYGKNVGGTIFKPEIALRLSGSSKRIYKFICRWKNLGGVVMDLLEFKEMLGLEDKYPNHTHFKKRVLDPARERIAAAGELVTFEYKLSKVNSPVYNKISFKIFSISPNTDSKLNNDDTGVWYKVVYNFLGFTYNPITSDKSRLITDKLAETNYLRDAYLRFKELKKDLDKGQNKKGNPVDNNDIIRLTKHILKNDFNIGDYLLNN